MLIMSAAGTTRNESPTGYSTPALPERFTVAAWNGISFGKTHHHLAVHRGRLNGKKEEEGTDVIDTDVQMNNDEWQSAEREEEERRKVVAKM